MTGLAFFHPEKNRVYVRLFDHDEARARRAAGESIAALAREYGVTWSAVYQVVANHCVRERVAAAGAAFNMSAKCVDCGKNCAKYRTGTAGPVADPRCIRCAHRHYLASSVRADTLQCSVCREWKPDDGFPRNRTEFARRGRHKFCTPCGTRAKRDYRARNREAQQAYDREYKRRRKAAA